MGDGNYRAAFLALHVFLPLVALGYVLLNMSGVGFATYVSLGPVKMHAVTAASLIAAYSVASIRLVFLSIPWRQIVALSLVVLGGHLYDVLWGFFSVLSRGSGFPWVPLFAFALTGCVVAWLDMRLLFLRVTEVGLFLFSMGFTVFLVMVVEGFYQQMTLYETAGGADPSSLVWAVGKFLTLMVFPLCTLRGKENRLVNVELV